MLISRTLVKVGLLGAALMLSACGQDYAGVAESKLASKSLEVSEAVKEAEVAMAQVEVAMAQVDLASIDQMLLDINDVTDGSNLLNLKGRLGDVEDILNSVLAPLIGNFGGIGTDLESLREEIVLHISNLDPSVVKDAGTIARLEDILDKLSGLQGDLTKSASGLVGQLDFIDELLDKVTDKVIGAVSGIGGIPGMIIAIPLKMALKELKKVVVKKIKQPLIDMITKGFGGLGNIGEII